MNTDLKKSEFARLPTEMYDGAVAAHPVGRFAEANEIANGVVFLASDESSYLTGSEFVMDGGYTAR